MKSKEIAAAKPAKLFIEELPNGALAWATQPGIDYLEYNGPYFRRLQSAITVLKTIYGAEFESLEIIADVA